MMITRQQVGLLSLFEFNQWIGLGRFVVLVHVAGFQMVIAGLKEHAVLGGELLFYGEVRFELFEFVVRARTVFETVPKVGGVGSVSERAELAGRLDPIAIAAVFGAGGSPNPIAFEQAAVFLLGERLRKR